jgi:hypothetical protein
MTLQNPCDRLFVDKLSAAEAEIQRLRIALAIERLRSSRLDAELSLARAQGVAPARLLPLPSP